MVSHISDNINNFYIENFVHEGRRIYFRVKLILNLNLKAESCVIIILNVGETAFHIAIHPT